MSSQPVPRSEIAKQFLDLHHYWFDGSLGQNEFTGKREEAEHYMKWWVETGRFPPDHTLLEIHIVDKFEEWLNSSWKTEIHFYRKES